MDETGLPHDRYENSFPWIADFAKAQTMMGRMHQINWPNMLDAVATLLPHDNFVGFFTVLVVSSTKGRTVATTRSVTKSHGSARTPAYPPAELSPCQI